MVTFSAETSGSNMFFTFIFSVCKYDSIFDFIYITAYIVVDYLKVAASAYRTFLVGHFALSLLVNLMQAGWLVFTFNSPCRVFLLERTLQK